MFYSHKRQSRQENIRSQDNRRYRWKALLTSPKTKWTFMTANRRAGFEGGRMAKLHRVCPTFLEAGHFRKQWRRLSHECHYHTINMYESGIFDSGRMANQNGAKFHTYMNVCVWIARED